MYEDVTTTVVRLDETVAALAVDVIALLDALDRQVLDPRFGTFQTVDGLRLPAWLIVDGADASSEAVYGLAAYVRAGGSARRWNASSPARAAAKTAPSRPANRARMPTASTATT